MWIYWIALAAPLGLLLCDQYGMNYPSFPYGLASEEEDTVDNALFGNIQLKYEAGRIGDFLRKIANEDLGVYTLQNIYDSLSYSEPETDAFSLLAELVEGMQSKIDRYKKVLAATRQRIESLYAFHGRKPISERLECCQLTDDFFTSLSHSLDDGLDMDIQTSLHTVCDLLPNNYNSSMFNPGRNLTSLYSTTIQNHPMIKWQYFVSTEGVQSEYPAYKVPLITLTCEQLQARRHREVYTSTLSQRVKRVLIVVDVSKVLTMNQLEAAIEIARLAIESLSEHDLVNVMTLSAKVEFPPAECLRGQLAPATGSTKQFLLSYINSITISDTQANHTLGLETALQTLPEDDSSTILYVSRGMMSKLTDAKDVMSVIASEQSERFGGKVIIHTFGLMHEHQAPMYERTFLQDIATQNFSKFSLSYPLAQSPTPGLTMIVCNKQLASHAVWAVFNTMASFSTGEVLFSSPYNDLLDQGLVVSLSTVCNSTTSNRTIGVAALDLHLQDLTEPIMNSKTNELYAFLITRNGSVVMHPTIQPELSSHLLSAAFIHFSHYEALPTNSSVVADILTHQEGNITLPIPENATFPIVTVSYAWRALDGTPYIVVVKSKMPPSRTQAISGFSPDGSATLYHRLDLQPTPDTCLHFQQLASFSSLALFLSAAAFEKPYEHLRNPETKRMVTNYLTYIQDTTKYISSAGLKPGIKESALTLSKLNDVWVKSHSESPFSKFIVRRYAATPNGVMAVYPALLTNKLYNPVETDWYRKAASLPGRIILSRPLVDSAGAGYVVTLSHTIYEGRTAALHTTLDPVTSVMAADVPATYLLRLMNEIIPSCRLSDIKCLLIDDRGYLIAHPDLRLTGRPNEQQHVTHMEPLIGHDILAHLSLVAKRSCVNFADSTVQRYYHFNTSMYQTVTNLKVGEQCLRYQMVAVPATNAFIITINETCVSKPAAFCPCSRTDRLCLNCYRMEQTECECPCECPRPRDTCPLGQTADAPFGEPILEPCRQFAPNNILFRLPAAAIEKIPQCSEPQCSQFISQQSCMGVVGCSWCETDIDGVTPLAHPRCDLQRFCFGGVLGSRTPYNDQLISSESEDDNRTTFLLRNSPIGPVTGAILGVFLILVLAVYVYKLNSSRRARIERESHESSFVEPPEHSGRGYVYHELQAAVPGPSHLQPQAQANLLEVDDPTRISPYHVNVNYQPPRPVLTATESSDHGYSTMTPHDDAESCSTSCVESISGKTVKSTSSNTGIKLFTGPKPSLRRKVTRCDSESKKLLSSTCLEESVIPENEELERAHILST